MNDESSSQALRAIIALSFVVLIAHCLNAYSMVAPFSATCALFSALPAAPFSKPRTLVLSHVLCVAVGCLMWFSPIFLAGTVVLGALISIMLMIFFKALHAPAVAHASILIILRPPMFRFAATVIFTAVLLAALSHACARHQAAKN